MELRSERLGVDHDWVVAFEIEDANLKQRPINRGADQHDQALIQRDLSHRVPNRMPYLHVGDPVLSRRLADPHQDNIGCLVDDTAECSVNDYWLHQAQRQ